MKYSNKDKLLQNQGKIDSTRNHFLFIDYRPVTAATNYIPHFSQNDYTANESIKPKSDVNIQNKWRTTYDQLLIQI